MDTNLNPSGQGESFDLSSILGGTSGDSDTTGAAGQGSQAAGSGEAGDGSQQGYKFGGRAYRDQTEAEKAHNQLYGRYSEQQSMVNRLKSLLKTDPEAVQRLASNPQWRDIMAKLGIQAAEEEYEEEEAADPNSNFDWGKVPAPMRQLYEQQQVSMAQIGLEREKWGFERSLGRQMSVEENDQVMKTIQRAPSLSISEAWKLVNHDKLLKEAQAKAQANGRPKVNRPSPIPGIPGMKVDLKKDPSKMGAAEWREHLKNSDEFKQLLSRG